jgi:hypothetical protein
MILILEHISIGKIWSEWGEGEAKTLMWIREKIYEFGDLVEGASTAFEDAREHRKLVLIRHFRFISLDDRGDVHRVIVHPIDLHQRLISRVCST